MPVALPPGRFKLATNPMSTGSLPVAKTMVVLVVAALAASAAGIAVREKAQTLAWQIKFSGHLWQLIILTGLNLCDTQR